jgi:hypothetical protein
MADAVVMDSEREQRRNRAAEDLAVLLAERDLEDPDQLEDLTRLGRTLTID